MAGVRKKSMKKLILLLLFPVLSQASTTMGLYDIYNMSSGIKKCDAQMITDPSYTTDSGNFRLIMFRCKTNSFGMIIYNCTITSLNEWMDAVNDKGTMNAYDFIKVPTSSHGGQGNFQWDYVTAQPSPAMNPWCLQ